jgi:hypothetical protein
MISNIFRVESWCTLAGRTVERVRRLQQLAADFRSFEFFLIGTDRFMGARDRAKFGAVFCGQIDAGRQRQLIRSAADREDFSRAIREGLPPRP